MLNLAELACLWACRRHGGSSGAQSLRIVRANTSTDLRAVASNCVRSQYTYGLGLAQATSQVCGQNGSVGHPSLWG